MTTDNRPWRLTHIELPDPKVPVETRIWDQHGLRNEAVLFFERGHWFIPKTGTYVYYKPTHWRPLPEPAVTVTDAEVDRAAYVFWDAMLRLQPREAMRAALEAAARVRLTQ